MIKHLALIVVAIVFLISCKQGDNHEQLLEERIWETKSGERADIYFQKEDKTVYMWNVEVASEVRQKPDFSADDLITPKGNPTTNKFPDEEDLDIRVGWETVGGYKIMNDTFFLAIKNREDEKRFHIAKVYDTLINENKYKAIQMYRYDGSEPSPVKFLSKEK